jgi:hypothetical protein
LESLTDFLPHFPVTFGWASSYEALFASQFFATSDIDGVLVALTPHRRILLTGRGGGGKTAVLVRLAKTAFERGTLPVIVNLVNWTSDDNRLWESLRDDEEALIHFLLQRFASPKVSTLELNLASGPLPSVLLIDGLSEIEARIGASLLKALDTILVALPGSAVIAADRLVRRELRPGHWRIASLLPLPREAVESVVSQDQRALAAYRRAQPARRELLRTPYFLDRFLRGQDDLAETKAAEQHRWFTVHASLTETELALTAKAAFDLYHQSHSRTFPPQAFIVATSPQILSKLRAAGALVVADGDNLAYFDHQLKHDFLAARYLSFDPTKWEARSFDTVTLNANSFDVLELVLEQLHGVADTFVRKVYDWNPYGAAYVVAHDQTLRTNHISASMRLVVQAVMAERRFHLMLATIQQAEDALRLIHSPESGRFLRAKSFPEVTSIVNTFSFENVSWFDEWKSIFTHSTADQPTTEELTTITKPDSVAGWTYANIIKRQPVSSVQQDILRSWVPGAVPEVRWRIVHALGAFPTPENATFLVAMLEEQGAEWQWVRYGATRSLVEMAVRDSDGRLKRSIMSAFASRIEMLLKDRQSLGEFARAVLVIPTAAPKDWSSQVKTVLAKIYIATTSAEDRARWLKLADDIESLYERRQ